MVNKPVKVVVIGGGTGSYVTLLGLKKYVPPIELYSIVTVADSGGSAKQERDEFGLLPVSDVRKALLALAAENDRQAEVLRELFNYRFVKGGSGLQGGTFGNLFLVALTEILGSEQEAIREAENILRTRGQVIPVALHASNLVMEYENGQVVVGEHYLDDFPGDGTKRVSRAYLLPALEANQEALAAINNADWIVFPPGDLYASIIVNLMVNGVSEALQNSMAQLVYIVNLMTKYGQTYGMTAMEHVQTLEKYIGCEINYVVMHRNGVPERIAELYAQEKDFPVVDDLGNQSRVIREVLCDTNPVPKQPGDTIKRSLLRHDPGLLASVLMRLINS